MMAPRATIQTARGLLLPHWGLCQKEKGTGAPFSVTLQDREGDGGHPLFLVPCTPHSIKVPFMGLG